MVRGIQSAAAGMIAQTAAQDLTANNLANANTPGYKRDVAGFGAALSEALSASARPGAQTMRASTDFRQGTFQNTGERFHLALDGEGFFAVRTASGTAYTRDGSFSRDSNGYLVTQSGDPVLGTNGPIRLSNAEWRVDASGEITQGGRSVGALRIERFPRGEALSKAGGNLWTSNTPPQWATGTRVRQGGLESSNVSTVGEMVSMMTGFRVYEAGQKAIQAQDETLDRLVNEVGRVA